MVQVKDDLFIMDSKHNDTTNQSLLHQGPYISHYKGAKSSRNIRILNTNHKKMSYNDSWTILGL